ncbi:MAG: RNA polymerase sigma factor [bacterium]
MEAAARVTADLLAFGGDLSDEDVVRCVRAGDTALFELLMRRHSQRLYRVTGAILHDAAEAEDVLQEAYVRAYEHLDQFRGRARFSTWLTRIAVNEALRRRQRKHRFTDFEMVADFLESPHRGPETCAFDAELRLLLEAAINEVPERYRTVFVLREVEGRSTADTAACLSIQEETVRTRLHRARLQLRGQLSQALGAESTPGVRVRIRALHSAHRRSASTSPRREGRWNDGFGVVERSPPLALPSRGPRRTSLRAWTRRGVASLAE